MKQKKGFTMVEVSLSLVLVGLIMLSVFATVSASINISLKDKVKFYAVHEVDNLVQCYTAPDNGQGNNMGKMNAVSLYLRGDLSDDVANATAAAVGSGEAVFYYAADGTKLPIGDRAKFRIDVKYIEATKLYTFKAILQDGEDVIYAYNLRA